MKKCFYPSQRGRTISAREPGQRPPTPHPAPRSVGLVEGAPIALALRSAAAVGGYAWWYVEVHDDEHRFGLTLILFVGSVFSPSYAARLRRGERVTGLDVPAVNLAVYTRREGASRPSSPLAWVMNEHAPSSLRTDENTVRLGQSALRYLPDGGLRIEIDEHTTRFFGRAGVRLTGTLTIGAPPSPCPALAIGEDSRGAAHVWQPLCPCSPAAVELDIGGQRVAFRGTAYCDRNYGAGRLEDAFSRWGWAHGFATDASGARAAVMLYDASRRDGTRRRIAIRFGECEHGSPITVTQSLEGAAPEAEEGGGFFWLRVPQRFSAGGYTCERSPDGRLLDAPFYARFAARIRMGDVPASVPEPVYEGVGEYLDLDRFRRRPIQHLLRYKTRRVTGSSLSAAASRGRGDRS